MIKLEIIFCI